MQALAVSLVPSLRKRKDDIMDIFTMNTTDKKASIRQEVSTYYSSVLTHYKSEKNLSNVLCLTYTFPRSIGKIKICCCAKVGRNKKGFVPIQDKVLIPVLGLVRKYSL